jgi:hypothetical protein
LHKRGGEGRSQDDEKPGPHGDQRESSK